MQLGYGARQRRIWTAETDRTSAIGESISRDKDLTKSLLESCGVPVPEGRMVDDADDAGKPPDIGVPVVVKPYDGNHGRGVFTNLTTQEEVQTAYAVAIDEGNGVIVERFVPGNEHRLLVVGGRPVAAAMGETASVVGDGKSTVEELIELQINSDPRRGSTEDHPLNRVRLDSAARPSSSAGPGRQLGATGRQDRAGPAQRQRRLRRDRPRPPQRGAPRLAGRPHRRPDIAGVDRRDRHQPPLAEQGGAVVEVNAGPGLLMHIKPADGQPRPVGRAIVEHLFKGAGQPGGDNGRIPLVGITGTNGKTIVAKLVARLLQLAGKHTGRPAATVCSSTAAGGRRRPRQLGRRAPHPDEPRRRGRGVRERQRHHPLRRPAYDRCRSAWSPTSTSPTTGPVLHRRAGPHVQRTAHPDRRGAAEGAAVLNARDPMVVEMAELCDGEVIFGLSPDLPATAAHRAAGKRSVFVRDGRWCSPPAPRSAAGRCLGHPADLRRPRLVPDRERAGGRGHRLGAGHLARPDPRRRGDLRRRRSTCRAASPCSSATAPPW